MHGYKTNRLFQGQPYIMALGYDGSKVQAGDILVQMGETAEEGKYEKWGHYKVTAVDHEVMTIELADHDVRPIYNATKRPMVHGEQRNEWGATEGNVLEARAKYAKESH